MFSIGWCTTDPDTPNLNNEILFLKHLSSLHDGAGSVRPLEAAPCPQDAQATSLGAHHANVRTQLSKGLYILAMTFPREGYSANKFISFGEEVYDDFSRQPEGPVNVAFHDTSIVLTMSGGWHCVWKTCHAFVMVVQLLFIAHTYLILSLKTVEP